MIFILIIFLFWFMFVLTGIIEVTVKSFGNRSRDKIGLLCAALLFGILIGSLSQDKFTKFNFCLMNPNDKQCKLIDINCFSNTMPIQAVDYGFGKFVKSKKRIEKGIGYVKISFTLIISI